MADHGFTNPQSAQPRIAGKSSNDLMYRKAPARYDTASQPLAPVRPRSAASTPARTRSRWLDVGSSSRAAFKTARRIELVLDLAEREGKVVSSGP
jgi:hypothetical protein